MRRSVNHLLRAALALAACVTLTACLVEEEGAEPTAQTAPQTEPPPATTTTSGDLVGGPRGSSHGKAKEAAKKTVGELENRDFDLPE